MKMKLVSVAIKKPYHLCCKKAFLIIKNVCVILPTQQIAFYVMNDDTFTQVLPFAHNILTNKAIAIEQLLLFRRI